MHVCMLVSYEFLNFICAAAALQGNLQNQTVVFECKACDYINFILRNKQFQDCSIEEVNMTVFENV